MRSIVLVVVMILTLYMAGMFRHFSLLVLFLAELFVLLLMWIFSIYFSLSLNCGFKNKFIAVERGMPADFGIRVTNRALLPVTRLRIRLTCNYQYDKRTYEKHMYGIADRGETELGFNARFSYSGIVVIKMKKLTAYDYLSLFSSEKKLVDELKTAVFPSDTAMDMDILPQEFEKTVKLTDNSLKNTDIIHDARDEIKQVREYEPGDSSRNIHWNLSARMDQLRVREYDDENDILIELLLDLSCGKKTMSIAEYDAFFCILTAMTMGMLKKARLVRVRWYEGSEREDGSADVYTYEDCCDMLLSLYNIDFSEIDTKKSEEYIAVYESDTSGAIFRFDTRLNLKVNGETLRRFDPINWRREI